MIKTYPDTHWHPTPSRRGYGVRKGWILVQVDGRPIPERQVHFARPFGCGTGCMSTSLVPGTLMSWKLHIAGGN